MKNLRITVNGVSYDVQVEELGESAAPAAAAQGEPVAAPMPGTILSVNVTAGQKVTSGQVLVVLEAMKMENEIKAPKDATVTSVAVAKGETVDTGATLVTLA